MSFAPSPSPLVPLPLGTDAPPTCEVPHFAPVRVRGGRRQLRRFVRHRGRAPALGLAVTAAALVAAGPRGAGGGRGDPATPTGPGHRAGGTGSGPGRVRGAAPGPAA